MSKIVHVSWLNPSQNVDLYPNVLEGMTIAERIVRPTGEFFFLATIEDAQELKSRMEKYIPRKSYTVVDTDNVPVGQMVSEPVITILDI